MPRPVTLFTGQWADLPFEEVCRLAAGNDPTPSFADGLQVQLVLDAVVRSAESGSSWEPIAGED